jgi:hypothetical protein
MVAMLWGAPGAAGASSPLWVRHVERYPGGISNGVRAQLDPAVERARAASNLNGLASTPAAHELAGPLDNVLMNSDSNPPLPQNETAVALKPGNTLVAVAAANDYVKGGLWVGRTSDGGKTWASRRIVPRESNRSRCSGADPSVVYSRAAHAFYLSQLCFQGVRPDSEILLYESTDGGASWSAPSVAVSNRSPDGFVDGTVFYDKELLAVNNNPGAPGFGRIYMAYVKFHMLPSGRSDYCPAQLARTNHFGGDWIHTAVVRDDPDGNGRGRTASSFPTPVVDDRNGVNVIYSNEYCNNVRDPALFFRRSTNGGASFGPLVRITKPGQYADDPTDMLPNKRAEVGGLAPSLAFNPVTKSLEVVYGNYLHHRKTGANVSFQRSTDRGHHWSNAHTISIRRSGKPARNDQFMPSIAADEAGGLHAIWYDNRRDPQNRLIETFQGFSSNDGRTWTNRDISTEAWNPNQSFFDCGCFIGDYAWIAASTEATYPVWTDGRNTPGSPNGDTDIFTNVELAP